MKTPRTLIALMVATLIPPACARAQEVQITSLTLDDPNNPTNLTFYPLPVGTVSWSNASLQTYCSLDFTRQMGDAWLPLWQNRLVTNTLMSGPLAAIGSNGLVGATIEWFDWVAFFRPSAFPSNSCFFRLRSSTEPVSSSYTNRAVFINLSSSVVSNLVAEFGDRIAEHVVPELAPRQTNCWFFPASAPIPEYLMGIDPEHSAWVTGRYDIAGQRTEFSFGICGYLIPEVRLTILDSRHIIE